MSSKIVDFHSSRKVPVFVQAQEIIDQEKSYSIEEIVKTFDELSEYEKELKKIKQQIIEATYTDIVSTLIEPIDTLFEEEFE
jgi:hypothetical protein